MISFSPEQLFLVTGATSGIGLATAHLLNSLGAAVVANGRDKDKLAKARESAANPDAFHPAAFDLMANIAEIPDFVSSLRQEYGKFSGFCSCAGIFQMDSLRTFQTDTADAMLAIHYKAPLLLAKTLADRRNNIGKGASIVFVAALGGVFFQAGLLSYGAAKAAMIGAAKSLGKELAPRGIRVNCVSPALVRTPMTEGDYAAFMGYDVIAEAEEKYPLGLGMPEDVAAAAVFLLSGKARWITGQNIILEGGAF